MANLKRTDIVGDTMYISRVTYRGGKREESTKP